MKNLFFAFFLLSFGVLAQSVTIDPRATTNGSAIIKAQSTTAGTLVPNVTSSQRTLIASPPKGLLVFDTDTGTFWFHNGTTWVQLVAATSNWTPYNSNTELASNNYARFNLGNGTNTTALASGVGTEGTLKINSPSPLNASRYLSLDGNSIQARRINVLTDFKTENNLLLNPFGGNIGIGLSSPNAPLQFASTSGVNRKIVLYEEFNNNHQFYGFGINDGILRYQTTGGGDHVFYSATSASASKELMRIKYDGNVKLSEGMYSNQTGNLNMVPLGIVSYWCKNIGDGSSSAGNFTNEAGSLVLSIDHFAESSTDPSDGLGVVLHLDPAIVGQYRKVIPIVSNNFDGQAWTAFTNTVVVGFSSHFNNVRLTANKVAACPDEICAPANYQNLTIEVVAEDFSYFQDIPMHGKVIFYGIK